MAYQTRKSDDVEITEQTVMPDCCRRRFLAESNRVWNSVGYLTDGPIAAPVSSRASEINTGSLRILYCINTGWQIPGMRGRSS